VVFTVHGGQKLFVFGIAGVQGAFAQMGAPLPTVTGPLIGVLEFFGGVALILGVLTRPIALGLACDMLGAILIVHYKNGFFVPMGVEFVGSLLAAALTLFFTGPGAFSLDARIAERRTDRTLAR
jgi:putative oxidoreductase